MYEDARAHQDEIRKRQFSEVPSLKIMVKQNIQAKKVNCYRWL